MKRGRRQGDFIEGFMGELTIKCHFVFSFREHSRHRKSGTLDVGTAHAKEVNECTVVKGFCVKQWQ